LSRFDSALMIQPPFEKKHQRPTRCCLYCGQPLLINRRWMNSGRWPRRPQKLLLSEHIAQLTCARRCIILLLILKLYFRRLTDFCRAILCISAAYAVMRYQSVCLFVCLSVRPSVMLVYSHQTILVCHTKRYGNIPMWTPNRGVECRWGRQKSRFSTNTWLHCVLSVVRKPSVIHTTQLRRTVASW